MKSQKEDEKIEDFSIFQALAHQHRRDIFYLLQIRSYSISDLAALLEISLPAIHKHIKILKDADLIEINKSGTTHFLTLNREPLKKLKKYLENI